MDAAKNENSQKFANGAFEKIKTNIVTTGYESIYAWYFFSFSGTSWARVDFSAKSPGKIKLKGDAGTAIINLHPFGNMMCP